MRHIFFHTTLDTLDGPDCITSLLERLALIVGEVFVKELFAVVEVVGIDVKDVVDEDDIEVDVTSSERGALLPRSSIMAALDCPAIPDSF